MSEDSKEYYIHFGSEWSMKKKTPASEDDYVCLLNTDGQQIASFPHEFLQKGNGNTSFCGYLVNSALLLLFIDQDKEVVIRRDNDIVRKDSPVKPGMYYVEGNFLPRPGPYIREEVHKSGAKRKFSALIKRTIPALDANEDEVSNPFDCERDTDDEGDPSYREYRELGYELTVRDCGCIITGARTTDLWVLAFIFPQELGPEMLRATSGKSGTRYLSAQNAMIMTRDMRKLFDSFLLGIYVFKETYYVHVFAADYHHVHGKKLKWPKPIFHPLPSPKLLEWHYTQCLMLRARAYSVRASH